MMKLWKDSCTGNTSDPCFTGTIVGLASDTTYYYIACFQRSGIHCQESYNVSFHTLVKILPPKNVTGEVISVSGEEAGLKGTWESNDAAGTEVWFEYGKTNALGSISEKEEQSASGYTSQVIENLDLNTDYFFKFVVKNSVGTTASSIKTFKTSAISSPPISTYPSNPSTAEVFTYPVNDSVTTDTSATLWGWGKPDSDPTTVYFRYSEMPIAPIFCSDIYGSNMVSTEDIKITVSSSFHQDIGCQSSTSPDPNDTSCLRPDTMYYYCAIASSKKGIKYELNPNNDPIVKSFKTKKCATCPQTSITTKPATAIIKNAATLNGFVDTDTSASVWFEYGKNNQIYTGQTIKTLENNVVYNTSAPMATSVFSLLANTIYRYRAIIRKNDGEVIKGDVITFKTKTTNPTNPCDPGTPIIHTYNPALSIEKIMSLYRPPVITTSPFKLSGVGIDTPEIFPIEPNNTNDINRDSTDDNNVPYSIPANFSVTDTNLDTNFEQVPARTASGSEIMLGPGFPKDPRIIGGSIIMPMPIGGPLTPATPTNSNPCPPENPPPRPIGPVTPSYPNYPSTPSGGGEPYAPGGTTPQGIPVDAIVRFQEGVEHVFVRQIIGIPAIAKAYGYQSSMDLTQFANDLAHRLAKIFGYIDQNGKEIRVRPADVAAYELKMGSDGLLMVIEHLGNFIISSRKINEDFKKPPADYEYNYVLPKI
jgi:hypothetical protein